MNKLKIFFIIVILSDYLFAQKENTVIDPFNSEIGISSKYGVIIDDYECRRHLKSEFIGFDVNIPFNHDFLRFQFNHHFMKYDRNYSSKPKNIGKLFRNEMILSYVYTINLNRFFIGFSGGIGYCYEKGYYEHETKIPIPISFETGIKINKYFNSSIEIRKNLLVEESSYFMGLRFEVKPSQL
jgi:hypothetical protein